VTYRWDYHPTLDTYVLYGPWVSPAGRKDPRESAVFGRVNRAAGGVYWACPGAEKPVRFGDLNEAKAYTLAVVRLS
jgi:hypothetical protein